MNKLIDKHILDRFLVGNYSEEDLEKVRSWFQDQEYEKDLDQYIFNNWKKFEEKKNDKDFGFLFDAIQDNIKAKKKTKVRYLINSYRNIAAILLIPILIISSYFLIQSTNQTGSAWAEIYSPPGSRTQFILPDGTTGWLNSQSSIKYPINFNKRKVKISGEAYFSVTKNKDKFVVETPAFDITVLGTKFNVTAYPEDNFTQIVLEEGKVKVDGKQNMFTESLFPDEQFIIYKNQKTGTKSNVDSELYSVWTEGKLVFQNKPLSEVLQKMEHWYNVKFIIENEEIKNYIYKATFKDENLDEILKLLTYTAPISYKTKNRKINADGTYSKKEIIIRKKEK